MRPLPLLVSAAVILALALTSGAAAVADPGDWDAAVAAAQQVDPTFDPPPYDPSIMSAVGGGRQTLATFPTFSFSARVDATGTSGRMTLNLGSGNFVHADVVCLAAAPFGFGGAVATLVGLIEEPPGGVLAFHVTDGGTGGQDAWQSDNNPTCVPQGSAVEINGGIAINLP